jgi:hypothetical protein
MRTMLRSSHVPLLRGLCVLLVAALPGSALFRPSGAFGLSQTELAPTTKQAPASKPPDPGTFSDGTYRNSTFGVSYKVPYGWVDRTEQMRKDSPPDSKSMLLLAVFERPPEAKGDDINSAIVFTAEPVSAYPGLKTAADYFDPLTEMTTGKGFKVVEEPYEFAVGTKKLVRGDFKKDIGSLSMYQTFLVTVEKGYVVSFSFITDSEDDLEAMIMDLNFTTARRPARKH